MAQARFVELFTADKPVIFAFHGYQWAIHQLVHGRPAPERFHVRGFVEQGTTTTPFDMVVRNGMSCYHLSHEAVRYAGRPATWAQTLMAECKVLIDQATAYAQAHFEDPPAIRNWIWTAA